MTIVALATLCAGGRAQDKPIAVSGRYPHLAMVNKQGECGTGAVVPWADRLWVITYAPHQPSGSDDKLYEIATDLTRVIRPESVGGTPANRMIHRESNQLLIGPYLIDAQRNVRVIPPGKMFGRLTATARHLSDPAHKVYYYDMEGLIYEADVTSLDVKLLYKRAVPGWHGKGAYTSQGRFVVANNGESHAGSVDKFKPFDYQVPVETGGEKAGALGDWDGKLWRLIERRQFTEVTGPGGIYGPPTADAPLWAVGWDKRSLLLKLLDSGQWQTFRLPKADYSYNGAHGWHTEWPRIREVVPGVDGKPPKLLMNMHGGWFDFPATFSAANTAGLRPIGSYAKVTGDFAPWNDGIVFGCDDTALSGFSAAKTGLDSLNSLNGQSCSNLWFSKWDALSQVGRPAGFGGVWIGDAVKGGEPSSPYLFAGYDQRVLHLSHGTDQPITVTIELDKMGNGQWSKYENVTLAPRSYRFHVFPADLAAQWVRLTTDRDTPGISAYFHYGPSGGAVEDRTKFVSLADATATGPWCSAVLRSEGDGRVTLAVRTQLVDASGKVGDAKHYQVGPDLKFSPVVADSAGAKFLDEKVVVKDPPVESDDASVILKEGSARFRLPKSDAAYDKAWATGWPRMHREVVTERSLLNVGGSFYILPRTISGGIAHLKPLCTHNKQITDFCSWRGLLVLAGTRSDAKTDGHYFAAPEAGAGLWFGDIDDLWKLGKPRGAGGPWKNSTVSKDTPSDPYLMVGYDKKTVELSHDASGEVEFTVEVDFLGTGVWRTYQSFQVSSGKNVTHEFPTGYSAHWVRVRVNKDCRATAWFIYT